MRPRTRSRRPGSFRTAAGRGDQRPRSDDWPEKGSVSAPCQRIASDLKIRHVEMALSLASGAGTLAGWGRTARPGTSARRTGGRSTPAHSGARHGVGRTALPTLQRGRTPVGAVGRQGPARSRAAHRRGSPPPGRDARERQGHPGAPLEVVRDDIVGRFRQLGCAVDWRLLTSSDRGVSQLRPRVISSLSSAASRTGFAGPQRTEPNVASVGDTLVAA